jgi:hypothetical protein
MYCSLFVSPDLQGDIYSKPAKPKFWLGRRLARGASRSSPYLLAIPAFDRIAGVYNRHLNSKGECANANDFEVKMRALTGLAKD